MRRHMAASTPNHQTHKSRVTTDNECRPIREDWFTHRNISSEVMVKLFYKKISVQHELHIGQNEEKKCHTTYFAIFIYVFPNFITVPRSTSGPTARQMEGR